MAWPGGRVRGFITYVAPTGVFALIWDGIRDTHIPLQVVSSIRRPHFSEPLDGPKVRRPERKPAVTLHGFLVEMPGQFAFDLSDAGLVEADDPRWTGSGGIFTDVPESTRDQDGGAHDKT